MFLCEVDLGVSFAPLSYCSGSSDFGYSLAVTFSSSAELREAGRYRERWRFVKDEQLDQCDLATPEQVCAQVGLSPLGDVDTESLDITEPDVSSSGATLSRPSGPRVRPMTLRETQ
eukprot:11432627-Heterocapsa_arctica.AAC.1